MKVHIMLMAFWLFVGSATVEAQDVVAQMNEVKGNAAYCYGEGADENPQTALNFALEELATELSKKTSVRVNVDELRGKASKLERKRGAQTRVLVYVPLAQYNGAQPTSRTGATTAQKGEQPVVAATAVANQPPVVQQTEPVSAAAPTVQPERNAAIRSSDYAKAADVVKQMKMVKSASALKKLLEADMEGGLIKTCGTHANVKDVDNVYWWVFRKGEWLQFVTVLTPVRENGKRINLETGEEQSLMDFQGSEYGSVWFTLP